MCEGIMSCHSAPCQEMGLSWMGSGGDSRRPRFILWLKKTKVLGSLWVPFTTHICPGHFPWGSKKGSGEGGRAQDPLLILWLSFQSCSNSFGKRESVVLGRHVCLSASLSVYLPDCLYQWSGKHRILSGLEDSVFPCPSITTSTSRYWSGLQSPLQLYWPGWLGSDYEFNYLVSPPITDRPNVLYTFCCLGTTWPIRRRRNSIALPGARGNGRCFK